MVPFLELKQVSFSYHEVQRETPAVKDLNLTVQKGEFLSVIGPSGCGKSTLLSLISGLLKPEEGEILLKGKPFCNTSTNIGYMLQKDHLFEWRTIWSNVLLGLEIQKKLTEEKKEQAERMLKEYGLIHFKQSKPSQLSGGMRQRAALIRTLATEPELLLLDEPFSALDYQTRLSVCDDIYGIIRKEGKTAILITHDIAEAISMGDRVAVLTSRPGQIKTILPISFTEEYDTPLKRRNAPAFSGYFNYLWKELNSDASDISPTEAIPPTVEKEQEPDTLAAPDDICRDPDCVAISGTDRSDQ